MVTRFLDGHQRLGPFAVEPGEWVQLPIAPDRTVGKKTPKLCIVSVLEFSGGGGGGWASRV